MDLRDLQEKNRELSILNSIAQNLNRGLSLDDALKVTLEQVVSLFDLKTGWIWLFEATGPAQLKAAHNLPPIFLEQPQLLEGTCYCIEKYQRGKLDSATNISEITCTRLKDLKQGTDGLRYHASIPINAPERKIGILNVLSSNSQQLSEQDLQLLYTIGDMLSIAIERTRLFERSKQLGMIEERNRLAREIHDTLAQGLSAISLKLATMGLLFDQNRSNEQIRAVLDQTLQLTQANLEDARRSVLDLRASPLVENGLDKAIQQLLEDSAMLHTFHCQGDIIALPIRIEMGIYRIAQEAIQNIIKHAEAQSIDFQISFTKDRVKVRIQDDGKGFDPLITNWTGFGLQGINERVKLLQGQVRIESHPGAGTLVHFEIPLV